MAATEPRNAIVTVPAVAVDRRDQGRDRGRPDLLLSLSTTPRSKRSFRDPLRPVRHVHGLRRRASSPSRCPSARRTTAAISPSAGGQGDRRPCTRSGPGTRSGSAAPSATAFPSTRSRAGTSSTWPAASASSRCARPSSTPSSTGRISAGSSSSTAPGRPRDLMYRVQHRGLEEDRRLRGLPDHRPGRARLGRARSASSTP